MRTSETAIAIRTTLSEATNTLNKKFHETEMEKHLFIINTLIINTAIDMSLSHDFVIVFGEDIDLLVLLIGLASSYPNIYFQKPGKGKIAKKLYQPGPSKRRRIQ